MPPVPGRRGALPGRPGTAEVLAELLAVEELDVPGEALEQHRGDVLTEDDLIDFGAGLARADYPAAAAVPPAA